MGTEGTFWTVSSPFLIVAFSIFIAAFGWIKILFFTLPAIVFCLHFYYPGSYVLQIAVGVLWVLFVVGNSRVAAYSTMRPPKSLKVTIVVIGLAAVGASAVSDFFFLSPDTVYEYILSILCVGVIASVLAYYIILYVFSPLIVLGKEEIRTSVTDYYKIIAYRSRYACSGFAGTMQS